MIKRVHGHKKKVRICKHKPKPKPKPPPKPAPKPQADLGVTLTATLEQVTSGNQVAYTAVVRNAGPKEADDVVLSLTVPASEVQVNGGGGVSDFDCEAQEVVGGSVVECRGLELPSAESAPESQVFGDSPFAFVTVLAEPEDAGTFSAIAEAKSITQDPHPGNNRVVKPLHVLEGPPSADLSLAITGSPDPATVREGFVQTISVTNTGPTEATSVTVALLLPQGASVADVPNFFLPEFTIPTGICPQFIYGYRSTATVCFDTIASGDTRTATVRLAPSIHGPPTLETTGVVSSYSNDPDLGNNRASGAVMLSPFQPAPGVDLAVSTQAPESARAGTEFAIGFTAANIGLTDADSVQVSVTTNRPFDGTASVAGFVVDETSGEGTACPVSDQPLTCAVPDVPSDGRLLGYVTGHTSAPGAFTATVTVTSAGDDANPADNSSTVMFDIAPG